MNSDRPAPSLRAIELVSGNVHLSTMREGLEQN